MRWITCLHLLIESRFYKPLPYQKFFLTKHYYYYHHHHHHHHHHLGGSPGIDCFGTKSCPLKDDENSVISYGEIHGLGNASSVDLVAEREGG
jgi:hypothetical protein